MTEARAVDLLMVHKAEVLAATGWEGHLAGGRGFMVCDGQNVGYFTENLALLFPPALRKRARRLLRAYDPAREVVVALAVPVGERHMMALGKRTPSLPPEEAFLKRVGTPGCPPIQVVRVPVDEGGMPV
jgi:hypothetical protein